MSPVGSIPSVLNAVPLRNLDGLPSAARIAAPPPDGVKLAPPGQQGFGSLLDGLVSTVSGKQAEAADLTKKVLLGDSDQLHQSVIAMQEASVAFSLMVEVRNKLVESYQELMRMQI
jgi:flagellar hook-basal body complex protein FliE